MAAGTRKVEDFAGTWRIARRIDDRLGGPEGRFEGTARLVPDREGLSYAEEGLLRLGGAKGVWATRRYLWRPEGRQMRVLFADGRPFHSFDLMLTRSDGVHDCAPDTYKVNYDFARWPEWRTIWHVTGPRKNYRMESVYRRK